MGKGYKGRNPRGKKPVDPLAPEESDEEPKFTGGRRGLGGQASTAGMLPPSDSEEEDEEEGAGEAKPAAKEAAAKEADKEVAKPKPKAKGEAGQPKTAGAMPPSDSEDDDDDSESSSSSDNQPEYLKPAPRKVRNAPEPRDPEEIRKEIERLALIRKKREEDRLKRIAAEGWDRFAPVSETNKPPGHGVAPDHPDYKKSDD